MTQTITKALPLALATLLLPGTSTSDDLRAKEIRRGTTVLSRERPELDALGRRLRSFKILPSLAVDMKYNDNIFATKSHKENDFIAIIKPKLLITSDWNRHAFSFQSDAAIGQYISNDEENYEDFRLLLDGRFDVSRFTSLSGGLAYKQAHERRGSPDNRAGQQSSDNRSEQDLQDGQQNKEPTVYDIASAHLNYSQRFNRLSYQLKARIDRYTYDDNVRLESNRPINNSDRDRNLILGSVRLAYDILPQTSAFIQGSMNDRAYDAARVRQNRASLASPENGFDRDSNGYEVVAGLDADLTGITYGNFYIGYTEQAYDDPELKTVSGLTGGATFTWIPSELTTVRAIAKRAINETIVDDASGIFRTRIGMIVDHELLRNLILNLNVFGVFEEFEGKKINRSDTVVELGFGAKYMLNRNVYVSLNYQFESRDSDFKSRGSDSGNNFGYDQNRIGLALQFNL